MANLQTSVLSKKNFGNMRNKSLKLSFGKADIKIQDFSLFSFSIEMCLLNAVN